MFERFSMLLNPKGRFDAYCKVTIIKDGDLKEEILHGVFMGEVSAKLVFKYQFETGIDGDWGAYIKQVVQEEFGIELNTAKDVKRFCKSLEAQGTTFKEW